MLLPIHSVRISIDLICRAHFIGRLGEKEEDAIAVVLDGVFQEVFVRCYEIVVVVVVLE